MRLLRWRNRSLAVGLIALVIVHVYFAVRPEKIDITKSMIFGTMKRDFYLTHYDPQRWTVEVPGPGTTQVKEEA